ncbi:hypothetical protein LX36DRAFT_16766 [Colletotrichum falcatum]|nr:hypothetical protein LX36DRAFT_16766 [Colletotrichum falcatum]
MTWNYQCLSWTMWCLSRPPCRTPPGGPFHDPDASPSWNIFLLCILYRPRVALQRPVSQARSRTRGFPRCATRHIAWVTALVVSSRRGSLPKSEARISTDSNDQYGCLLPLRCVSSFVATAVSPVTRRLAAVPPSVLLAQR